MSAKRRILKLIKTPSAKKKESVPGIERRSKGSFYLLSKGPIRDRADPTSATGKLALARAGYFAIII